MSILADIANIIGLTAISVRDVLWLRVLLALSGVTIMPYYYFQATPLWVSIFWSCAYLSLNVFWIVRLLIERRPVQLSAEEQHLYRLLFRTLTPREMVELLKFAEWEDKQAGNVLEEEGKEQDTLDVIVSGTGRILSHGREAGSVGEGAFIGKAAYLTREKAPISVVVETPMRIVSWRMAELRKFLSSKPDLAQAMQITLGFDLQAAFEATLQNAQPAPQPK
jgi:CRP-like cAMP-binding protein